MSTLYFIAIRYIYDDVFPYTFCDTIYLKHKYLLVYLYADSFLLGSAELTRIYDAEIYRCLACSVFGDIKISAQFRRFILTNLVAI